MEKHELERRIQKLHATLNSQGKDWNIAFIVDKINHYYLTGTMQDGVFVLKNDGGYAYFARNSYERAKIESPLENVYKMVSYNDVAKVMGDSHKSAYIETDVMTVGMLERIKKYFNIVEFMPIDRAVSRVRAVKSEYELACMEESGRQHNYLLETIVPSLLKEGMTEAELTAKMYEKMIELGYQGVTRFAMFQTEMIVGQIGFGENSIYPTSFDGPGGMRGMSAAVPQVGSRERLLKKGDLVFTDIAYGIHGYHTDRTQIYMFGQQPSDEVVQLHNKCLEIQKQTAALLKTGNIPSKIYNEVTNKIDSNFMQNFMGFGESRVKFLGHGVGLYVDEYPVIANGFDEPLEENITIALEPKYGLKGVGLLGVEDTYIVTKNGGRCITFGEKEIIVVC